MRAFRLLPLAGLLLIAGSGAPMLAGCDSGGEVCTSTDTFTTEDITPEGTDLGASIAIGQCVQVAYIGRFADGSGTFDEGSLSFVYSTQAGLIPGFVLGMAGQRVRQTRRVQVPPDLGYGSVDIDRDNDGTPEIPACSTLEFDITVTAVFQDNRQCQ